MCSLHRRRPPSMQGGLRTSVGGFPQPLWSDMAFIQRINRITPRKPPRKPMQASTGPGLTIAEAPSPGVLSSMPADYLEL